MCRDHCLFWTRLVIPAAGRWCSRHLQLGNVGGGSSFLASLIELDELYKTRQQRVDGVQKWSAGVPWTRVSGRCVINHQNQTTFLRLDHAASQTRCGNRSVPAESRKYRPRSRDSAVRVLFMRVPYRRPLTAQRAQHSQEQPQPRDTHYVKDVNDSITRITQTN